MLDGAEGLEKRINGGERVSPVEGRGGRGSGLKGRPAGDAACDVYAKDFKEEAKRGYSAENDGHGDQKSALRKKKKKMKVVASKSKLNSQKQ